MGNERIALSKEWNGHDKDVDLRGVNILIPKDVSDSEMACGGREALDRHLRNIGLNKTSRPCGECAVADVCVLTQAQG